MASHYKLPPSHDYLSLIHYFEVPVIAVFTKYEQFLHNVAMDVLDYPEKYSDSDMPISEVTEKLFQEHYLHPLGDDVKYVRLQSRFRAIC